MAAEAATPSSPTVWLSEKLPIGDWAMAATTAVVTVVVIAEVAFASCLMPLRAPAKLSVKSSSSHCIAEQFKFNSFDSPLKRNP
eukprot:1545543-Pyramimonas_sp.AAC.1